MLLATVAAFGGYALLLPVLPLWAVDGGAGPGVAGAVTGVFMASTVVSQLGVPRLLTAVGHRRALVLGCLALGLPAALLPLSAALAPLLGIAVVRGTGFGVLTVTGAALVAELVPPGRRGRAAGVYGLAIGAPQLVLLTGGVWAWTALGPVPVLLAGAAAPLLALPALRLLPARVTPATCPAPGARNAGMQAAGSQGAGSQAAGPGSGGLVRRALGPWTVMVVSAASAGGVITVLPLTGRTALAGAALLALTAAQLAGRYLAGEVVDRWARPGVVTPLALGSVAAGGGLIAAAVGGGALPAWVVLVGAALVGAGFGAVQNDTLVTLFARAGAGRTGVASSIWNTAYDSGTGLGATALAAVLGGYGATASFVVAGVACAVVLPVAAAGAAGRSS